jgi:hypothetical protein
MRTAAQNPDHSKKRVYWREYLDFWKAVYRPGLCDPLWVALNNLYRKGIS